MACWFSGLLCQKQTILLPCHNHQTGLTMARKENARGRRRREKKKRKKKKKKRKKHKKKKEKKI